MILELVAKSKKTIASCMLALLYFEMVIPAYALGTPVSTYRIPVSSYITPPVIDVAPAKIAVPPPASGKAKKGEGGPTQPESQAFHSVNNGNMVDLFSGNFTYNIPLLDVGGYPLAIGYNSGISMDQEASWVGLGWNINPGTITRNMRGLPDDFDGTDTIQKVSSIKDNTTIGVTGGLDLEIFGLPKMPKTLQAGVGGSLGLSLNSYKGVGMETSLNASLSAGSKSMGSLTSGLSFTNSSQEGITSGTSLSYQSDSHVAKENGSEPAGSLSAGLGYNTRSGLKALQITAGVRQYKYSADNKQKYMGSTFSSDISFAHPSFTPTITLPYTSSLFSFTVKLGSVFKGIHGSLLVSGYYSKQGIAAEDQHLSLPAYGYLNYQNAKGDPGALLDYNREKEIAYREKPAVPNIAVPAYTYDAFSITGEGTGGMFRAYRSDIGYVYDHHMKSKDMSGRLSGDIGVGDMAHWGVDLNYNRSYTQSGPWQESNPLATNVAFRKSDKTFEAAYFRNPGESAMNTKDFYDNIGGDDVVAVNLFQPGNSGPNITTTNILNRYRNKKYFDQQTLSPRNTYKKTRDKRTQVISYLTAAEASAAGLSKYIENYKQNTYSPDNCNNTFPDELDTDRHGLYGEYFRARNFKDLLFSRVDTVINFQNKGQINVGRPANVGELNTQFCVRWTGRLKPDVTGAYQIITHSDDGVRLTLNDSVVIDHFTDHPNRPDTAKVNLVAGELYNLKLEYYQSGANVVMDLKWRYAGLPLVPIPRSNLYLMPSKDTFLVGSNASVSREKRVNDFRKKNHISEIDVLNADGRRYVYGIPVYNLKQKEVTFSANAAAGNKQEGLVKYTPGVDNTTANKNGNDNYFNSEEVPAYAHSFLLTGVLSPDYVDLTGDGITGDDPGNAIKFNYTKISGIKNPYRWRAPYNDSATYSEGLKTDNRDDKGSYVYGEKELWYLNSIESKNMVAIFKISNRNDQPAIDENGTKYAGGIIKRLDEINLYTKADLKKYGTGAKPVKTVHFEYNNELCPGMNSPQNTTGKLTLKKIWFSYNGNEKGAKNPYIFNYNTKNPRYNAKSYDRWGNYKDPLQNPGSTTNSVINNDEYPYALQDSTLAAQNAAAWTLDSMVLPSGGRLKIDYESDDYAFVQNRRAAQMFKIAGFSAGVPASLSDLNSKMYGLSDYMYVSVNVPKAVSSNQELFSRYLEGMDTFYFRLFVKMPSDKFGSGSEYVSCYATIEPGTYGYFNGGKTIWLKLQAINKSGETGKTLSVYNPLATAAIQYLRLSLPSKAYPGSDVGGDANWSDGIKILLSQADNLLNAIQSYDNTARLKGWANQIDTSRSFVRLNSPTLKKYGGGIRVKRILNYDHWNNMTKRKDGTGGQKESVYGLEYSYTTIRAVNGRDEVISSGVATYEPTIGGDENPWRLPLQYNIQVAALAPVSMGYTEKPLGEAFYPAPSVGYSNVRVRSVNTKNKRSVNGFEEVRFYTSYDFPTLTDMTLLADNKKRYKPLLTNFLRINAKHFLAISQGFKVELNDMNGKVRSTGTYPETDAVNPISYTENYYKVDDATATFKHLTNTAMVITPQGIIDTAASIGKDVELMMDMREQKSVTNALNFNLNSDAFSFSLPPIFLIPTLWSLAQREEILFRSVAVTKIVNRHGILDSIIVKDKSSTLTTKNLLFDSETGNPVLTRTINVYDDPVYNFSIPSGWTYDGMSGAYKNIGTVLNNVFIKQGKIISGITPAVETDYFTAGDEILIGSKQKTSGTDCVPDIATFPAYSVISAVDANALNGGTPAIYFVDHNGLPFTGNDISMKIIRSGRRNINTTVGKVTSLGNPLVKSAAGYTLVLDNTVKAISVAASEFKQFWKTTDIMKAGVVTSCAPQTYAQYAGTNSCGPLYYGNAAISQSFTKSDCGRGFVQGNPVTYTVPEGSYSSNISQADADAQAAADLAVNGQTYADMNGICKPYYYSAAVIKDYTKVCTGAGTSYPVTYIQPYGADSSLVSQQIADSLGIIRADTAGQAYANANGICTYLSGSFNGFKTKNDCPPGGVGSSVQYSVAGGAYESNISQADADAQVQAAAQAFANMAGSCTYSNVLKTGTLTKNNCTGGSAGSAVNYVIPAGTFHSNISQADADAKAALAAQDTANLKGVCVWSSAAVVNRSFTRNNCSVGTGTAVIYNASQGAFTSNISQADADAKATAAGQLNANTNGLCNINATLTYVCNDKGCTQQAGPTLTFTFPTATTAPITLLMGVVEYAVNVNAYHYRGSNIFTPPAGSVGIGADPTAPFVITIPAGVTTYATSGTIYQQGYPGNASYTWFCQSCQGQLRDLYVKSATAGLTTNFMLNNAGSTVIHNVP